MEKQQVKIEFPEIKVVIGSKETIIMKPITITAADAKQIKQAIKGKIPRDHVIRDMKKAMIEQLKHGVNIELADGTVVAVPMEHKHGWQFDVSISTSMINKASGQHVPVTYANFVHNALYKLKHGDSVSPEAQAELIKLASPKAKKALVEARATLIRSVSQKAKATLIELGYIKNGDYVRALPVFYVVSAKGVSVLEHLSRVDPAADPSCRMKLTRAMFCKKDPTLPAFEWAEANGFIEYVRADAMPRQPWYVSDYRPGKPRGACWYPTEIGAAWLEKNAVRILKHHSCSATRKGEMIPFMPLSHLSEYLSHTKKDVRDKAERRLRLIKA